MGALVAGGSCGWWWIIECEGGGIGVCELASQVLTMGSVEVKRRGRPPKASKQPFSEVKASPAMNRAWLESLDLQQEPQPRPKGRENSFKQILKRARERGFESAAGLPPGIIPLMISLCRFCLCELVLITLTVEYSVKGMWEEEPAVCRFLSLYLVRCILSIRR